MRALRWGQVTPRMKWTLAILLLANLLLAARGLQLGSAEISDGASSVTDGNIIAGGVALTILGVVAVSFLPFPPGPIARAQAFILGSQILHASGHVFGWYYSFKNYDDVLHIVLPMVVGLIFFDFARARKFLFTTRLGPTRVAILVIILAIAVAGFWEIFEFTTDLALGTREQDNLPDTMLDMIDGLVGGLIAGAYAYRSLTNEQRFKQIAQPRSDELLD